MGSNTRATVAATASSGTRRFGPGELAKGPSGLRHPATDLATDRGGGAHRASTSRRDRGARRRYAAGRNGGREARACEAPRSGASRSSIRKRPGHTARQRSSARRRSSIARHRRPSLRSERRPASASMIETGDPSETEVITRTSAAASSAGTVGPVDVLEAEPCTSWPPGPEGVPHFLETRIGLLGMRARAGKSSAIAPSGTSNLRRAAARSTGAKRSRPIPQGR